MLEEHRDVTESFTTEGGDAEKGRRREKEKGRDRRREKEGGTVVAQRVTQESCVRAICLCTSSDKE